ncbi:hypothetical protein CF319_g9247, partial [Tilletia indica]
MSSSDEHAERTSDNNHLDAMSDHWSSSDASCAASSSGTSDDSSSEASSDLDQDLLPAPMDMMDEDSELAWSSTIPAPAAVMRWYNDVLKLTPKSSSSIKEGLQHAQGIIKMARTAGGLAERIETVCVVALRFLHRVARRQSTKGKRELPGTALSVLTITVVCEMEELLKILTKHNRRSPPSRAEEAEKFTNLASEALGLLRDAVKIARARLGMLKKGPASQGSQSSEEPLPTIELSSVRRMFRLTMASICPALDRQAVTESVPDLETLYALYPFLHGLNARKKQLKRSYAEIDGAHSIAHDADREASVETSILQQAEQETDRGTLDYKDRKTYLAHWRQAVSRAEQASEIVASGSGLEPRKTITFLQFTLIALCQLGLFKHATILAELTTSILREAFDDCPTFDLQRQLCHSLAALGILLRKSGRPLPAADVLEKAVQLLQQTGEGRIGKEPSSFLASLRSEYAFCVVTSARHVGKTTYAKGVRAAKEAVSLWRKVNKAKQSDWEAKYGLARALDTYAKVSYYGASVLHDGPFCELAEEATELYRDLAKIRPHFLAFPLAKCLALFEHM